MTRPAPHADDAEARAKAKVGKSNAVGMCAEEVIVNILGIPAPWKWGGNGKAWAYNYFLGAQKVVKTSDPMKIPAGAVVIHKPRPGATTNGGKAGHIAIGAGNGYEYSTDLPREGRWGKVKISYVEEVWGKELAGYVLVDGMGYDVSPPAAAKPPVAVWGKPATFVLGATGPDVVRLGERLVVHLKALGFDSPYKVGPSSPLSNVDVAAVKLFQTAQGWTGEAADGYPGAQTFKLLAADPSPTKPVEYVEVEYISINLASYDKVRGLKNRVTRARTIIPEYLLPKRPDWFHFQECAIDVWPVLDRMLKGYTRVPAGGKGRESYYRNDIGIRILKAELRNVAHMLGGDTKEYLLIAWERDDARGVYANLHNENDGSSVQDEQLRDVMTAAREFADDHDIDRANIAITGDTNFEGAAAFAWAQGWTEARRAAKKPIDMVYKTTNGWAPRLVKGSAIDVDIFQRNADVREAEMLFGVISDHYGRRIVHGLIK